MIALFQAKESNPPIGPWFVFRLNMSHSYQGQQFHKPSAGGLDLGRRSGGGLMIAISPQSVMEKSLKVSGWPKTQDVTLSFK